jgi:hypothetical protein
VDVAVDSAPPSREIFPTPANLFTGNSAPAIRVSRRKSGKKPGTWLASLVRYREAAMASVAAPRGIFGVFVGLFEHAFFVIAGFVLMVLGLGLSVTMIMLPVGLVIGLLGFAMFVGGMTVRMDKS